MSEREETDAKPEWLQDMTVLRVEPGDVVVVRGPAGVRYSPEAMDRIGETLKHVAEKLGIPGRVVFMDGGLEVGVVRGAPSS